MVLQKTPIFLRFLALSTVVGLVNGFRWMSVPTIASMQLAPFGRTFSTTRGMPMSAKSMIPSHHHCRRRNQRTRENLARRAFHHLRGGSSDSLGVGTRSSSTHLDLTSTDITGGKSSIERANSDSPQLATEDENEHHGHSILGERVLHDNWRKLISRTVRLPNQATADFEIVSQGDRGGTVSDQAVLVFVWDRSTQTAQLVREYMPSVHRFVAGLAAGMVEDKHGTIQNAEDDDGGEDDSAILTAARFELEEECRRMGGTWYRLCAPTTMDKYTTTRLSVYLVVDSTPVADEDAKPRDDTEQGMHVVPGVTLAEIRHLLRTGGMTVVGSWATLLALDKLRELGEIE